MKNLIGVLLMCIFFISCIINHIGTGMFTCKVEGNINDKIIVYPLKQEKGKRIKKFTVNNIQVSEKIDSTIWEKVWIDGGLKPIKGKILYGQTNENIKQALLSAKRLKEKSIYDISFDITSYWIGHGVCTCRFKVDENGNVENL